MYVSDVHYLFSSNQKNSEHLNPIQSKGGHYGPDDHKWPSFFYRVGAKTTKTHDFVSLHI